MIKNKRLFLTFVAIFFSLLLIKPVTKVSASPSNNPLFATFSYVEDRVNELFNLLDPRISQNETDIDTLKEKANDLETENQDLKSQLQSLQGNILPEGKWVHVCFDVATANLSVMKGGTCFPHVHWKIFVQCYIGTSCMPDNPNDTYFVPPQEQ